MPVPEASSTPTPTPTPAPSTQRRNTLRPAGNWITGDGQHIFYRPRSDVAARPSTASPARFPAPLIGPRRSRPHAIHILTFPAGYVPRDLRVKPCKARKAKSRSKSRNRNGNSKPGEANRSRGAATGAVSAKEQAFLAIRPRLGKILSSFHNNERFLAAQPPAKKQQQQHQQQQQQQAPLSPEPSPSPSQEDAAPDGSTPGSTGVPTTPSRRRILPQTDDVISHCASTPDPHPRLHHDDHGRPEQSPLSPLNPHRRRLSLPLHTLLPQNQQQPASPVPTEAQRQQQQQFEPEHTDTAQALDNYSRPQQRRLRYDSTASAPAAMSVARMTAPPGAYNLASGTQNRMLVRNAKSAVSSLVTEVPKPVASGSGVSCSILLAEPNVFLSGFDHDGHQRRDGQSGTALLRGRLQINVSKNVKIKAIQLKLLGRARTEWPEGIPPLKQDVYEEEGLRTQVLTFFNAMHEGWESDYGNQCTYKLKNSSANSSSTNLPASRSALLSPIPQGSGSHRSALSAKDLKRLSLQNNHSRSFSKDESPIASPTQAKGFKVFYPGTYDYSFELPIDHHQLETTKLQYGSVKWELHATVDRAGAFKPNLHGMKEVSIVRVPDQLSLEMSEPISISRKWEDQLHYDIIISGKSFPIGSKIPIAFKLTPLAKVQVHKLKVFVTETIEYWTNDKRVTRKDPGRKILLLEKSAGKPLDAQYQSSEMRTVRGGELDAERRREAREMAARRREREARGRNVAPEPLPEPTDNILGDLELGLENMWGSTEIEANVQIPTCEMMAKNKDLRLHPDCSWKNVNVYHWIKIVLRISRLDPDDPTGTKRRHFEISIDSPFTVLNCRATQANTNLPAYASPTNQPAAYHSACGCPDAASVITGLSPNSSTGTLSGLEMGDLPAPPQAAHLSEHNMNPASSIPDSPSVDPLGSQNARPIHLMRVPSFNPPAFDADSAPPPAPELVDTPPDIATIATPPPLYDVVVGTPSVDGMADYFVRLAQYGHESEDSGSDSDDVSPPRILERSGRVNVSHPRTPGGRMPSRSFEFTRPAIDLDLASLPRRANAAGAAV